MLRKRRINPLWPLRPVLLAPWPSRVITRSKVQTTRDLPNPKRKAEELTSSDYLSETASCRNLFDEMAASQGNTGERVAQSSLQLGPTEVGFAYAAVVAGHAGSQQPGSTH
jgi:hypothetical protein